MVSGVAAKKSGGSMSFSKLSSRRGAWRRCSTISGTFVLRVALLPSVLVELVRLSRLLTVCVDPSCTWYGRARTRDAGAADP